MDVTIRPATIDDEDALRRIDLATWSADTTPAPAPAEDAPFFDEHGRAPGDVLVATFGDDEGVVGYVLVGAGFPMPSHEHVAFLRGLAVDPAMHGHGLGRRLVTGALAELAGRGARKVRSNVLSTNPASLAVHRATGFVEEGRLRGEFIIDGIGAVDDVLLAYVFDEPAPPTRP
jgi:ribosomal protein S18 acetylase RimI-like enzyme